MKKERTKKKRKKQPPTRVKINTQFLQLVIVLISSILLYFTLIYATRFLPTILVPLFCGLFIGLLVRKWQESLVIGFASSFLGALLLNPLALSKNLPLSIEIFLLQQAILTATGGVIIAVATTIIKREYLTYGLLILILLNFATTAWPGTLRMAQITSFEPPAEKYSFDGQLFMKIYYLVEKGTPFYKAWDQAVIEDARADYHQTNVLAYRMPTVFWLWSILFSNGSYIILTFLMLSITSMICAYFIARRFIDSGFALLAPALVGTYLLTGAVSWWQTELEYWSSFVIFPAVLLYLYGRRNEALPLAMLAGLIREWSVVALAAGFLIAAFERQIKEILLWGSGLFFTIAAYLVNASFAIKYLKEAGLEPSLSSGAYAKGGIGFILYTLQFGSHFFAHPHILPYLFFFLGLAGLAYLAFQLRAFYPGLIVLLLLIIFNFYGSGKMPGDPPGWGDYYNINFMPLTLSAIPLILGGLMQKIEET
jgi:hypothetical protein